MLELPDLDAAMRERFQAVVRDEVAAMTSAPAIAGRRYCDRAEDALAARGHARRRPGRGRRAAHRSRSARCGRSADEVDPALWLKVDSYSLLQALAYLAGRLVDEYGVRSRAAAPAGRGSSAPTST